MVFKSWFKFGGDDIAWYLTEDDYDGYVVF